MQTCVSIIEGRVEFLESFAKIISANPEFMICGLAASQRDAFELLRSKRADILLIDLALCGQEICNFINQAKQSNPESRFIITVQSPWEANLVDCIANGVTGFVTKTCSSFELLNCLRLLRDASAWVSPEIAGKMFQHVRQIVTTPQSAGLNQNQRDNHRTPCTPKELEILRAFELGNTVKRIAMMNQISPNTVTHHAKNIFRKLGAHSRSEAVYIAKQTGII